MQRPARLQAAVMWRAGYGGNDIVRGYARWFGVDLLCAIVELRLLGVAVAEQYEQQLRRTIAARAAARARHGADKLAVERQPLEIEWPLDWPIEWLPDDESVVSSADEILAESEAHDHRILAVLLDLLREDPGCAGLLAVYGDVAALPCLSEALDRYELVERESLFANHALIELRVAIEELEGILTAEQQLKCRRGRAAVDALRREVDVAAAARRAAIPAIERAAPVGTEPARRTPRPGRNEPCWCGSAKKYKKCHSRRRRAGRGSGPQMIDPALEWQRKGATLSDTTARRELGLTQDELMRAIKAGTLQYRPGSAHGNPYLRLLRHEVEALAEAKHGRPFLKAQRVRVELTRIDGELKRLRRQVATLEARKATLIDDLDR